MQTVALCAAQCLAEDVDAWGLPRLRALLPVAGMTVIEHQAERARAVGITCVMVLVDAVPAGLAEACDRIRGRGVDVRLARSGADVVRDSAAAARLLLVADGLIAGDAAWRMALANQAATLLTTPDGPMATGLERIDATTRWAGLAVVDRAMLSILTDSAEGWDPQLVLFRAAVQAGVPRRPCDSELFVSGEMALAEAAEDAAGAAEQMLARHVVSETGIFARWVVAPAIQLCSGALLRHQSSGHAARIAALFFALGAGCAALLAYPLAMAACGLFAACAHQVGIFVARFRPEARRWRTIGWTGLAAQLAALAIADRHMMLAPQGEFYGGAGGMTLTAVLIITLLLPGLVRVGEGRLVDPPLAWASLMLVVPALGWRAGFDLVGIIAAAALIVTLLAAKRRANP